MKICFYSENIDISRGSYRIWINDLQKYFKLINIDSTINPKNINDFDVIIVGKSSLHQIKMLKKYNKIVGGINLLATHNDYYNYVDFCIVGSLEEKDSILPFCKNVFLFPLIEIMYQLSRQKNIYIKKIIIGYHGNPHHLNHCKNRIKYALEKLEKQKDYDIELLCITSDLGKQWVTNT